MDAPRYDSRLWTDEIGVAYAPPPAALPPRLRKPIFLTPRQARLVACGLLLILASGSLPLSVRLVEAGTSGLMIAAPAVGAVAVIPALAGALLIAVARKTAAFARLLAGAALVGSVVTVAGAGAVLLAGARDRSAAVAGPPQRAFVAGSKHGSRRGRSKTFLQLASGERVETWGFSSAYGASNRCYLVRRLDGRRGFAWLQVLDASPAPAAGALSWPLDREKCFSSTPLSQIAG